MIRRRDLIISSIVAPIVLADSQTGTSLVLRIADRKLLQIDNPDFAAQALLPPASTIKPFVIFALLAAGKLKSDELFACPRRLQINGHELNCIHPPTPIPMNPARAIAYSCNGALAHFALRFAPDELPQALLRFGFASPSGLSKLQEASGSLKRGTVGPACQLQALGEEGIAITPLELLIGYVRLAEQLKNPKFSAIREGLEGAVQFGTAQAAAVPGASVAGKTGSIVLRSGSPAAWFAGFEPSRDPKLAVVVLTAGRSGGSDAAPIAASLFKRYAGGPTYKVQTGSGIQEMEVESYVAGVVSGEAGDLKNDEALKAMAVAARTYAARSQGRHAKEGFDFCSTTHCQRFVTPSARSTKAAAETSSQMLWFEGKPVFTVYSRSCGGKTEAVSAVWPDISAPYLNVHVDPYCSRTWNWSATPDEIQHALLAAGLKTPAHWKNITVVRRTPSGRAQMLSFDGELLSASAFRFAIGRAIAWSAIRSEQYTIENSGARILFRGSGEGHGVGLCQMGADAMAQQGKNYREILAFYYPGTTLSVNARDFHWIRVSGEGVVLYSLLPDSDKILIQDAENVRNAWRDRLPWPMPSSIEIYAYPDLDSFRNATGEPGWVAARTNGTKIEMQPVAVLKSHQALHSTLLHEMLHCFVESAAHSGLPVWFREGLVEHLAGAHVGNANAASENDIRQRTDQKSAENAYHGAQAGVENLIHRYGETTVLGWVTRGLPADVKYSTASNNPVNNK